ncbi:MAG: amidohydrolase [Planctomycetes bacterium]|nr:amidohydrolase [Planctomycetota bacterium]
MPYSDMHVHLAAGDEDPAAMLRIMDENDVERAVVLSVYPGDQGPRGLEQVHAAPDPGLTVRNCEFLSEFCSADPSRLIGFVWIEPRLPQAASLVRKCLDMPNIRGVKMIPNHWYPYEERIFPVYASIEEEDAPILFHSGILWGFADSSRFCRPVYYEALLHFPTLRFALAHISWPWTDECIAVAGRFRAACNRASSERPFQMWIDLTPGTPRFYRTEAVSRAIQYLGPERLIWGTDCHGGEKYNPRYVIDMDVDVMENDLALDASALEKIRTRNMDDLLGSRRP